MEGIWKLFDECSMSEEKEEISNFIPSVLYFEKIAGSRPDFQSIKMDSPTRTLSTSATVGEYGLT